ncbi:MAG: hypothetical protein CXZ00_00480 [Acidobacteria bacterium]|nr:MAG: hypothetical protein CXZ00_00480 [Acidobacteriota bacterium]
MERLNYNHLLYFYTVAREGSVARAGIRLGLKQPTVSSQIHAMEATFGCKLFERVGRGLRVTPTGETVFRYAESIFAIGEELVSVLDGRAGDIPKLAVGVSSSLPPALVSRLVHAVFALNPRPMLTVVEGAPEKFALQLASNSLQFALADAQPGNRALGKMHCRVLLECGVEVFAPEVLSRKVRREFPARLAGAPVLMPSSGALCREVENWLKSRKLKPEILAKTPHPETHAASAGAAIFAPSLLRESLKKHHGLLPAGELEGSRWRVFAVTAEKGTRCPGLDAVIDAASELH